MTPLTSSQTSLPHVEARTPPAADVQLPPAAAITKSLLCMSNNCLEWDFKVMSCLHDEADLISWLIKPTCQVLTEPA